MEYECYIYILYIGMLLLHRFLTFNIHYIHNQGQKYYQQSQVDVLINKILLKKILYIIIKKKIVLKSLHNQYVCYNHIIRIYMQLLHRFLTFNIHYIHNQELK